MDEVMEGVPKVCPRFDPPGRALFEKRIENSGDSAVGPNLLPQRAYRAAKALAAEVLEAAAHDLWGEDGVLPHFDWNAGWLALLLKKEWFDREGVGRCVRVEDTRSITVRNSDNKLLYGTMLYVLQPAMKTILEPEQYVLSSINDNIVFLQSEYHKLASSKSRGGVLLIDKRQAFPSVSHKFLMRLLAKMGFPAWFQRAVSKMMVGIHHIFQVRGWSGLGVWVRRGVPQGDPLSMIVFCIAFDSYLMILKSHLRKNEYITAFADDAAALLRSLSRAAVLLRAGAVWERATTVESHKGKTKWVHANPPTKRELAEFRKDAKPSGWHKLLIEGDGDHLGLPFGKNIGASAVFMKALGKAYRTITQWAGGNFSPHFRLCLAQILILSITSYLEQFVIMEKSDRKLLQSRVTCFIFRVNLCAWRVLALAPAFGLHRALPDLAARNTAALVRASHNLSLSSTCQRSFLPAPLGGTFRRTNSVADPIMAEYLLCDREMKKLKKVSVKEVFIALVEDGAKTTNPSLFAKKRLQRTLALRIGPAASDSSLLAYIRKRVVKLEVPGPVAEKLIGDGPLWKRENLVPRVVIATWRVLLNGLFTGKRMAQAITACRICGKISADENDGIAHIVHCRVVQDGLRACGLTFPDDMNWVEAWARGKLTWEASHPASASSGMLESHPTRECQAARFPFPFCCMALFTFHNFLRHAPEDEVESVEKRSGIWKDTIRSVLETGVTRKRKSKKSVSGARVES